MGRSICEPEKEGGEMILEYMPQLEELDVRRCTTCGLVKPVSEFYPYWGGRPGYRPICKPCHKSRANRYNAEHYAHLQELRNRWREANPDKCREYARRSRANQKLRKWLQSLEAQP